MDLQKIKFYCEKREGGLKKLASEIGMSEANLHRCIRINNIQAGDLEKIAIALDVNIDVFYDLQPTNVKTGDFSPVNMHGKMEVRQTAISDKRELELLRTIIAEKERIIETQQQLIDALRSK